MELYVMALEGTRHRMSDGHTDFMYEGGGAVVIAETIGEVQEILNKHMEEEYIKDGSVFNPDQDSVYIICKEHPLIEMDDPRKYHKFFRILEKFPVKENKARVVMCEYHEG